MIDRRRGRVIAGIAVTTALLVFQFPGATAGLLYSVDDGTGESSVGVADINLIWLNAFTVAKGGEQLNSIDIAFGGSNPDNATDPPGNGAPVTAYIWTSPGNNPDPTIDATVASSVAGTISSFRTNTFVNFQLPTPVALDLGDVFFAGFQSSGFAVARDTDSSAGQSWLFTDFSSSAMDPNALGSVVTSGTFDNLGFAGNALVRVNATSAVPTPATLALVTLGLIGLRLRRTA